MLIKSCAERSETSRLSALFKFCFRWDLSERFVINLKPYRTTLLKDLTEKNQ